MIIFLNTSHLGSSFLISIQLKSATLNIFALTWWICVKIPTFDLHPLHQSLQFKSFLFLERKKLALCDIDNQLLNTKISQGSMIIQKS